MNPTSRKNTPGAINPSEDRNDFLEIDGSKGGIGHKIEQRPVGCKISQYIDLMSLGRCLATLRKCKIDKDHEHSKSVNQITFPMPVVHEEDEVQDGHREIKSAKKLVGIRDFKKLHNPLLLLEFGNVAYTC